MSDEQPPKRARTEGPDVIDLRPDPVMPLPTNAPMTNPRFHDPDAQPPPPPEAGTVADVRLRVRQQNPEFDDIEVEDEVDRIMEQDISATPLDLTEDQELIKAWLQEGQEVLDAMAEEVPATFNMSLPFIIGTRIQMLNGQAARLSTVSADMNVLRAREPLLTAIFRRRSVLMLLKEEREALNRNLIERYGPMGEQLTFGVFREWLQNTMRGGQDMARARLAAVRRFMGREQPRTVAERRRRALADP